MPSESRFREGKYRWRTWLRAREPNWLYELWPIPKGRTDCGNHEFYYASDGVDRCYHCLPGMRLHDANELASSATS
jgi:hypothetical protein